MIELMVVFVELTLSGLVSEKGLWGLLGVGSVLSPQVSSVYQETLQFFGKPLDGFAGDMKTLWRQTREALISGSLFKLLAEARDKVKLRKKTKDFLAVAKSQGLQLLRQLEERATLAITMKL